MKVKAVSCSGCGETDETKFGKRTRSANGLQGMCKVCLSIRVNTWKIRNPEYHKNYGRRRREKYGFSRRIQLKVTKEDFAKMLVEQNNLCAMCFEPLNGITGPCGSVLDHDHETMRVRGVLHANCNKALGFLDDDPSKAILAAKYLEANLAKA